MSLGVPSWHSLGMMGRHRCRGAAMANASSGRSGRATRTRRSPSRRFLSPEDDRSVHAVDRRLRPWGPEEMFADGQWQAIRVELEHHGWNPSQIHLVHDQLRQGWPLETAKRHAARLSGHCPLHDPIQG